MGNNRISDTEADIAQKKDELHKLVVTGNTSIIATNSVTHDTGMGGSAGREEDREKKERENFESQMRALIDQNMRAINARIADLQEQSDTLHQQMDDYDAQIRENNRKIGEYKKSHENAINALRGFEENHEFQRDANGRLANKDAQRLLDEYVRRTGKRPESDAAIYQAIQRQIEWEKQNIIERLEQENKKLGEKREKTEDRADKVDDEKNRLEEQVKEAQQIQDVEQKNERLTELVDEYKDDKEAQGYIYESNTGNIEIKKEIRHFTVEERITTSENKQSQQNALSAAFAASGINVGIDPSALPNESEDSKQTAEKASAQSTPNQFKV